MIRIGQAVSAIGIAGVLFLFITGVLVNGGSSPVSIGTGMGDVVGAVTAIAVFSAWPLALFHWGTRYSGDAQTMRRWGFGLILGTFIAGWIYWFSRTTSRS